MRGHAYKRGSTWTVVYDEPSPDGKRRQRSKGGFPTQKAAQRFLTDQLSRIGGGTYVEPARTTVADWCEQWLGAQSSRLRPSAWESYRDVLRGRSCLNSATSPCNHSRPRRSTSSMSAC